MYPVPGAEGEGHLGTPSSSELLQEESLTCGVDEYHYSFIHYKFNLQSVSLL